MITRMFLLRHGETEFTRDDIFAGVSNVDLTDNGRQQAKALASRFASLPNQISAIYSSPMQRSIDTAQITADQLGLSVEIIPALIELDYGVWEGLPREEILSRFGKEYKEWVRDPANNAPPQGETGQVLVERVLPVVQELTKRHSGEAIIIVAHKSVNRLLICSLLEIPLEKYRHAIKQNTACLNLISFDGQGIVSLAKLNDISHYETKSPWSESRLSHPE